MQKRSTPSKSEPVQAARPGVPKEAREAFLAIEAEANDLAPDELEPINVDIARAAAVAVAAVPHLAVLRTQMVEALPKTNFKQIDRLGTYALAAWYAHLMALPSVTEQELAALLEEATPLRENLLVAAEALAHRGLLDPKAVATIRAGQGNLDKANDLVALAALFTLTWDPVKNKTTVEWAEVQRAAELGPAILVAMGARELPVAKGPNPTDPRERRQRAYTLFVRAYDECRRAVTYLRWHEGDLASITPPLRLGRGNRRGPSSDVGQREGERGDPDAETAADSLAQPEVGAGAATD